MKQKGAMLAKGWLLGLQFRELFKDDLYFELARHANEMARLLSGALMGGGYEFLLPPASNQLFVRLPNMLIEHLRPSVAFEPWDAPGDRASVIRLGHFVGYDGRRYHGVYEAAVTLAKPQPRPFPKGRREF